MYVATVGFFDGVHRGHRYLIEQVKNIAQERNLQSMVITLNTHPRVVLQKDYIPELLTTLDEKVTLLQGLKTDRLEVLHFDREMAALSAKEFMEKVLRDELGVGILLMGYDHRFGHGKATPEEYIQWGRECGIEVIRAKELEGMHASSSCCRRLLAEGDVQGAQQVLGYPYILHGKVVSGHQIGRQMGFPTANVQPIPEKIIPAIGVYAVCVTTADGITRKGVLNIGRRPTLDNGDDVTIEVNILDFIGNIYEQEIALEFVSRLRGETTFSSLEELQQQIEKDVEQAKSEIILLHKEGGKR